MPEERRDGGTDGDKVGLRDLLTLLKPRYPLVEDLQLRGELLDGSEQLCIGVRHRSPIRPGRGRASSNAISI